MKPNEIELRVWYVDRRGKEWRALHFSGSQVQYETHGGATTQAVGWMDRKKFASKCVIKANPAER